MFEITSELMIQIIELLPSIIVMIICFNFIGSILFKK